MSFTLACVMVRGRKRHYTAKWVDRLRRMVARHTDQPFRVVCLTDQPEAMPAGVEAIEVEAPTEGRGWWAKMRLFDPALPLAGRVLYLDLDVIVLGDLGGIIDFPADFAICADSAPGWQGADGLRTIKGYNSSCMVWDAGARRRFWDEFRPEWAGELWGDQDALARISPGEATFPREWFTRVGARSFPFDPVIKIGFCIKTKNSRAAAQWPWFKELWNAEEGR